MHRDDCLEVYFEDFTLYILCITLSGSFVGQPKPTVGSGGLLVASGIPTGSFFVEKVSGDRAVERTLVDVSSSPMGVCRACDTSCVASIENSIECGNVNLASHGFPSYVLACHSSKPKKISDLIQIEHLGY